MFSSNTETNITVTYQDSDGTIDLVVDSSGATETLTNKTLDVDNNTVSNIEVDNFKASAIVIESEGIASNDNDTTLPSSAAVKDFVDTQISSGTFTLTNKTITNPTISDLELSGTVLTAPSENTVQTLVVTVASKTAEHPYDGGSSNAYVIDGVEAPYITLTPDTTYRFDQSDSSNSGHPLAFYYDSAKAVSYTTGVTTNGTAGSSGAYTQIKATADTPTVLFYQCTAHALMGNRVNFDTRNLTGFDTDDLSEGSSNLYHTTERVQDVVGAMFSSNTETGIAATYEDSDGTIDLVIGSGVITNAMLAGSIANDKLAGSIANSKLANSTITVSDGSNSTATALGGTITFAAGEGLDVAESSGTVTFSAEDATASNKGIASFTSDFSVSSGAVSLGASGVTAADYGSATAIPVLSIDAKGRITSASTASVTTSFTLSDGSNTQTVAGGDTLTVAGTSNEVDVAVSATDTLTIGLPNDVTVSNNLTVSGNLVVSGTTTQTGSVVTDNNFTGLANANTGNSTDFGFYGKYVESSTTKYAGIFYDASTDNTFRLFVDTQTVPSSTVNTGATGYTAGSLIIGALTTSGITIGSTAVTATAAELNILDGVTSTAAELNILDGVTSTASELNILDGVTSTTAELNILDGVTSTTAELNVVDGSTSASSTTLADADRLVVNDNGTMKQVALTDFETYFESALDTLSSVTSVGTLSTLAVSGDLTVNTNNFKVDSTNVRIGIGQATPTVAIDAGSKTDAILLPKGTTAQRPTGAAGQFRYNTTLGKFEGYTDAWGEIGGGTSNNTFQVNTYTGDGSTTAFTLSQAPDSEDNIIAFIEGVYQNPNDFILNGTSLTFDEAPENGRKIVVYHVKGAVAGGNLSISTMTGDGSDTTLTLNVDPVTENNVQVYIDGVYQNKDTFSVSGTTLTFSEAPPNGSNVEAMTMTQTSVNSAIILQDADGDTKVQVEESSDEDKIRFDTAGSERVIIDNAGKVGVGTSTPSQILNVEATTTPVIEVSTLDDNNPASASAIDLVEKQPTHASDTATFGQAGVYGYRIQLNGSDNTLRIKSGSQTTTNDRITLERDTGNVGIGTTSPTGKLEIAATGTNAAPHIKLVESGDTREFNIYNDGSGNGHLVLADSDDDTPDTEIVLNDNGIITMLTGNSERMTIDSSGNVDIKDSNLYLTGSNDRRIKLSDSGIAGVSDSNNTVHIRGDNDSMKLNAAGNGSFIFEENGTEKMRIDTSGNLCLGTSSAHSGAILSITSKYNSSSGFTAQIFSSDSTEQFSIRGDGAFYTGLDSVSPYNLTTGNNANAVLTSEGLLRRSTSSLRYKKDIADATWGLTEVKQLRPITFKSNTTGKFADDKTYGGLIAEEVHDIGLTEFVEYNDSNEPDALHYGNMVALLTKAIQEQQELIETLQAKVEALENG